MTVSKPRILFVDDDELLLEALRRTLLRHRRGDWDMTFETSSQKAIDHQIKLPFQVVVTDLCMPKMDGVELAKHLHEIEPSTQYVMLTGTADLHSAMNVINTTPIFRFYTKPCPAETLELGIEDCLKRFEEKQKGNSENNFGLSVLDRLQVGVIICESDGQVIHLNQFAAEICADKDGLCLDQNNIVRSVSPLYREKLKQALEDVSENDAALPIPHDGSTIALCLIVTKLDDKVLMLISDPEKHIPPKEETLQAIYDLLPSEAQLLRLIVQGYSLQESAGIQGITEGSARTYLKRIFSKTNTSGQPELIRTVLLTPGLQS